jgi:putative ABC transport system ATP-binding protein
LSSVIELKDISKIYKAGDSELIALDHVSMNVEKEEMVAIMGESGSGKSTMLNIVGVLDKPTMGEYWLNGTEVEKLKGDALSVIRNKEIGFVFQSFFLLPRMTALQNVMLPLRYRGVPNGESLLRSEAMLEKVGIKHLAEHRPNQMSGGQQQRVAIARALIGDPAVILADEPTGALDSKTSQEVMDLFISLNKEDKKTIVIVTHDTAVGKQCGRIIRLQDGNIVGN